ncbi:MAG: GntR family transcriptional regulator [Steroidobacteraceae bacterium]
MDDFWATRTGRWRVALRRLETPTVVDRLYAVVRRDVEQGVLHEGAELPPESRFVAELGMSVEDVRSALEQLERDALIERQDEGRYVVSARGDADDEDNLFKAALRRVHASSRKGPGEYGED